MRNQFAKKIYKLGLFFLLAQMVLVSMVPFVNAAVVGVEFLETPISIVVTPATLSLTVSETQLYTATAVFVGGETLDVTRNSLTTWSSSDSAVGSINTVGLVTAVSDGTTNIGAIYGDVSGSASLTVASSVAGGGSTFIAGGSSAGGEVAGGEVAGGEVAGGESGGGEDVGLPPAPFGTPAPGEEGGSSSNNTSNSGQGTFQYITPDMIQAIGHDALESIFLPDEISVTRGEILQLLNDQLSLDVTYRDLVKGCLSDIDNCLSLFLSTSHFSGIVLDVDGANPFGVKRISRLFVMIVYAADVFNFGKLQLYPDVSPDNPYSYAVDIFTLLSFVQGYYKEMSSPFRAYQVITRMEATKVLLGSVGLIKWIPYSELEAALGGAGAVKNQKTVFADINSTREYMWWYPRYINLGCEVKMFDCVVGSNFRPDEFITEAEANKMLEELLLYVNVSSNYLETLNADDDKDLLKNYLEKDVYFTDPESKDTDYDGLSDKLEVYDYKTSPFLKDSDSDGLSDYEEVIINKTDPLKPDTDLDDFSDYVEVQSGTDPLSALSYPVDEDVNGVPDSWETENKVSVKDGAQDTDGDAISDKLEFQWGTDPNSRDTDGDGFTDTEEILEYNSDPLSVLSPGNLANIGVKITNFQENQLVADATPMIKGVAPFGYPVRILLRNDYGHEKILGSAIVDANNIFVFQSTEPLRDGRYMLVARSLQVNKKLIVESDPVHIIIDSSLDVAGPVPLKLDGEDVTPEVLLRNLKISIKDDRPVLTGQTEFGNKVTAVWKSVVISSVLIADSTTGEFLIQAPRNLGVGDHEVWLTAVRKKDSAQSETVKLNFKVEVPGLGDTIFRGVTEQMVPDIGFPLIGNLRVFVKEQGFLAWLVIGVTLFLMGALGWYVYMGRKK